VRVILVVLVDQLADLLEGQPLLGNLDETRHGR
jgi:hypothetical protein